MKFLVKTAVYILFLIFLSSCSDVINSDKNYLIITDGSNSDISGSMEFIFPNNNIALKTGESLPRIFINKSINFTRSFHILNKFKDSIIKITNVELENGFPFEIFTSHNLPVNLPPNQMENSIYFAFKLDSSRTANEGVFNDKIIINNNPSLHFFISVEIK